MLTTFGLFIFIAMNTYYSEGITVEFIMDIAKYRTAKTLLLAVQSLNPILLKKVSKHFVFSTMLPYKAVTILLNQNHSLMSIQNTIVVLEVDTLNDLPKIEGFQKRFSAHVTWLVETKTLMRPGVNYTSAYIPMNCVFLEKSSDTVNLLYQIREGDSLVVEHYGKYIQDSGFVKNQVVNDFHMIRSNFFGRPMAIFEEIEDGCRLEVVCIHIRMWKDMAAFLNFSVLFLSDKEIRERFGQYDGINTVKVVARDTEYNMVQPTMVDNMFIYIKDPRNRRTFDLQSFFLILSAQVWLCLVGWICFGALTTFIIFTLRKMPHRFEFAMLSMDAACLQDGAPPRVETFTKIYTIACRIVSCTLYPAFGAGIISYLAASPLQYPFKDTTSFLAKGKGIYKLGYLTVDDFGYKTFKNTTDPEFSEIGSKMMEPKQGRTMYSYEDAAKEMCRDPNYAFLGYSGFNKVPTPCRLYHTPKPIVKFFLGVPIAPDSPYKAVLVRFVLNYRSSGIIKRSRNNLEPFQKNKLPVKFHGVEFSQILVLIIILFIGLVLSVIILMFECFAFKYIKCKVVNNSKVRNKKLRFKRFLGLKMYRASVSSGNFVHYSLDLF